MNDGTMILNFSEGDEQLRAALRAAKRSGTSLTLTITVKVLDFTTRPGAEDFTATIEGAPKLQQK